VPDLRAALEDAIVENPHDVSSYMAYGDFLSEQGDPRGEFIQTQLAREDRKLSPARREMLQKRESELLQEHEREWLGPLARYLIDRDTSDLSPDYYAGHQKIEHTWRRGFLDSVKVHFLTGRLAQALADCPAANLLRELGVDDDQSAWEEGEVNRPTPRVAMPPGSSEWLHLFELIGSPCLRNLRVLRVGDESGMNSERGYCDGHCYTPGLEHVVADCPCIEELLLMTKSYSTEALFGLKNLTNLRVLHVEHMRSYPVAVLANNPALTNLEHIYFHPHFADDYYSYLTFEGLRELAESPYLTNLKRLYWHCSTVGDDGIRVLIDTGLLGRLKVLSLRHGCVTDAGVRLLEACPATRGLELLDLRCNQVTLKFVKFRRVTGVNVLGSDQHPVGSDEYLLECDYE
jgi:uncharacterized protein (TIGR02996 family)